ncbi:MAG: hypothetical protein MI867_22020 [Pseudomonadales bacterium]|nr:hypothetical protein [Pseudomonadales bacterium]
MAKEVELLSKSIKYIKGVESDGEGLTIGVIYTKGVATSLEQAKSFVAELEASKVAADLGLKSILIEVDELPTAPKFELAYISSQLQNQYDAIYRHAREHRVFTVSTNRDCVVNRCCILSFDASSGLNIFLNQSNLRALGFGINSAFKFMVKRL